MVVVRKFEYVPAHDFQSAIEVDAQICGILVAGEMFLQIETFGSFESEMPMEANQNIRLSKTAFEELVSIGKNIF